MPAQPAYVFDVSGGHLALDFVNTLSNRRSPERQEHLLHYADLVRWAEQVGIITRDAARRVMAKAESSPRQGNEIFRMGFALREAIYAIFSAVAAGKQPPADAVQVLNQANQELASAVELRPNRKDFQWQWTGDSDDLRQPLFPVIRATLELLTSDLLARVRECEADDCGWLFMDHSKNRSRRWCDMKTCGNREKARRFYQRSH